MAVIQTSIKLNDHFSAALRSMNNALNMAISNFESVNRASNKAVNPAKWGAVRAEIAKANATLGMMDDEINKATAAQNKLNNSFQTGWGKIKGLIGAYAGWQAVKGVVNAGDTYASNTGRLNLLTGDMEKTKQLQQQIYEASQRSLTNYNDMSNAVAKLGITASHAFGNTDEMVQFAELLNKQFKLGGAGIQEQSAAMYQLTQAMAAGKLQGDEFRSILENAPMLAQSIAKEMGLTTGELKEMSSQGKITADVIKSALFNSAKEINDAYSKLPMKFSDLWVQCVNKINKGLEPLYVKLGKMWNNPAVQRFIDGVVNGFLMVANVGIHVFEIIANGFSIIYDNWGIVEAMLIGLATVYLPTIISLLWAKAKAIWASVTGWLVLNWQILLIAAAIAGVVLLVRYLGVTFSDVCGFICGLVFMVGAVIWNVVKFVWNVIVTVTGIIVITIWNALKFIGNMVVGVCQWIANAWNWCGENISTVFYNIGVWWDNLWIDAKVGFYSFINDVLAKLSSLAQKIQPLADLFDIDLSGMISNAQASVGGKISSLNASRRQAKAYTSMGKTNWETFGYTGYQDNISKYTADYTSLSGAYNKGFNWGSGVGDKIGNAVGEVFSGIGNALGFDTSTQNGGLGSTGSNPLGSIGNAMKDANAPMLDKLDDIANNTSSSASSLSKNNEDMSYLRDLAEREAINKFTSATNNINMTNHNNVNSKLDLDTMVDYLQEKVYNTMLSSAEGTHY